MFTCFFGYQLTNLSINADVLQSLPDHDKDARLLKEIGEHFGSNNMGVIILETDNVYTPSTIKSVQQLSETLENIDGILSVTSLTNIINITGGDYGLEIGLLVDEYDLPTTEEDFDELRAKVLANNMYKGSIVSEDETSTLVIFNLQTNVNISETANEIIKKTSALNLTEQLYYIGSPMLVTYISEMMKTDFMLLLPIAFILIAVILFISFRSLKGVLLPLLTSVISIVWTMGLMAVFEVSMSMISNNIPIILLAIGTAYAIHVVNQVELRKTNESISVSLSHVLIPVVLASITTAIGFVSFIFGAYLEMIVDFGIFTALGTLFASLLSIFLVPSILAILPNSKSNKYKTLKVTFIQQRIISPIFRLVSNYPKQVLVSWVFILAISLIGVFSIERSVDIQEYFKKGNPTRVAEGIMIEKFGGTKPVFIHFKGDMQDPNVLKKMLETAKYMEKSEDINSSMSVAHLIAEMNFAITETKAIPDDAAMIQQIWFLLDGSDAMQRLVNEDLTEGIVISKFKSPDNVAKKEFATYMNRFIKNNSTEEISIEITGMPFVDITMDQSLLNSQLGSISIAIIFVILIVGIILKSLKSGLICSIPIIAALLILFGLMGLTGISLNIATVLVASVALGIGIDYSIHIISHYNKALKDTQDTVEAVNTALSVSGKAIVINVISVAVGFLVLLFSIMVPLQYFGLLIAVCMLSSSLGALTLLPSILIVLKKEKR